MRAATYTRVSTERQATEDKVSLDKQRLDIEAYCDSRGYEVAERYQDVGSGASKRRPAFQRMLRDAQADRFDVIVAWKSDRLSRGMYPAAALMEAIEGTEVKLEAVKDTIDINTFAIMAVVGKIELDGIRERVRMGMRGKAKGGTLAGYVRYGYKLEGQPGKKRPVVDEAAANVVRRIFEEYVAGAACRVIAAGLRKDGILSPRGKSWIPERLWDIIKDPVYIGKGSYGKKSFYRKDNGDRDVRQGRAMPQETWITVKYPTIIDEWTWKKAQERRRRPIRPRKATRNVPYLLKGLMWCGECGWRDGTSTSPSSPSEKHGWRVLGGMMGPVQ